MKVSVKKRSEKEKGLFATDDIKKGEYICVIPIDYIKLDSQWYVLENQSTKLNFKYTTKCNLINKCTEIDTTDFEIFCMCLSNHSKISNCEYLYRIITNNNIREVVGVSNPEKSDDEFIGHIINDFVDMTFLADTKYKQLSELHQNVKINHNLEIFEHLGKKRLGLRVCASKNIKKDDEIFYSYGTRYWGKYSDSNTQNVTLNLIGIPMLEFFVN